MILETIATNMVNTPQVEALITVISSLQEPANRDELQQLLDLKERNYFSEHYLNPAIREGLIEMTIPDKS